MNKLIVAFALGGGLGGAYAGGDALEAPIFSDCATVETVREAPIAEPLRELFEHALNPDTAQEIVVRTDDGRAVVLRHADLRRRFAPGERVHLLPGSNSSVSAVTAAP